MVTSFANDHGFWFCIFIYISSFFILISTVFVLILRQFRNWLVGVSVALSSYVDEFILLLLQVVEAPLYPPLVLFLVKDPLVDKFDLSSLKFLSSGAAPLARDLEIGVVKRLPYVKILRQGHCIFLQMRTFKREMSQRASIE